MKDFGWSSLLSYYTKRKHNTIRNTLKYNEDLIAKACHPERKDMIQWTCDIGECKDFEEDC